MRGWAPLRALPWVVVAALAGACGGTGDGSARSPRSGPARVRIAAASDLRVALDEVIATLARDRPDLAVTPTYGSSGQFFAQISNRAPFDLFLSADLDYPRQLIEAGLAEADSLFRYGVGRIVLWVPATSSLDPEAGGLALLARPEVRRIAIADPRHAPYGRAAQAALRAAGVYESVEAKLVLGSNVSQAAQFVDSGAADCGIIALSLALGPAMAGRGRHLLVPPGSHPQLDQGGVVLRSASDPMAARAVRDYLTGERARAVFSRFGFSPPGEGGAP